MHFKEIRIILDGFGEGDTTFKKSHRVQADATFDKTYALIEIAGPEANRPGSLTRFGIVKIPLEIASDSVTDPFEGMLPMQCPRSVVLALGRR